MSGRQATGVSQLVKMYGQPTTKPFTPNRTPASGRPWEQNSSDQQDSRPVARSGFLNQARSGGNAPRKFGNSNDVSSLSSSGSGSEPAWKRNLARKAEESNDKGSDPPWKREMKNNAESPAEPPRRPWEKDQQQTGSSDPPWKKPTPGNAPWSNNRTEKDDKPMMANKPAVTKKPWMGDRQQEEKPIPAWKQRQEAPAADNKPVPLWKQKQAAAAAAAEEEKPIPPWKQKPAPPATEKPSWMRNNEAEEEKSVPPWKQKQQAEEEKPIPAWKQKPPPTEPAWKKKEEEKSEDKPNLWKRPPIVDKPKPAWQMKKDEPPAPPAWKKPPSPVQTNSWNTPTNDDVYDDTAETDMPEPPPPILPKEPGVPPIARNTERSSFLHKSGTTAGKYRRKPIPNHVLNKPPPMKPSKPFNVQLPGRPNAAQGTLSRRPLPPPGGAIDNSDLPPPPGARDLPLPVPPGASSELPPPIPSGGLRDRNLPQLPPPSAGPPLPSRPGPALPPGRNLPPEPAPTDDIYDDTEEPMPEPMSIPGRPAPPPLNKQPSADVIPTWDDEDEVDEAIYDDTPENDPRGMLPQLPEPMDDFHEDPNAYQRRKDLQAKADAAKAKEEEKKKKEAEKKEKDMRKKYKLPKEGEIAAEMAGYAKANSRGGGKDLAVQTNERLDIIRTKDNPKGKFLARNSDGMYGYVDSDNITIDYDALKNTMQSHARASFSSAGLPPPLPPTNGHSGSGGMDDEAIYDETADDELVYEEL